MFRLKRFPQVWVSASEPYELSLTKEFPYRDTLPVFQGGVRGVRRQANDLGTGYPKPRWELPMDKELEFVEQVAGVLHPAGSRTDSGQECAPNLEIPERLTVCEC